MEKRLILFTSLVLFLSMSAWAQRTVTGKVIDEGGETLIGVNVLEVGTSNGTITDIDGMYSLQVKEGASLQFSLIGYSPTTVEVGAQSTIDVTLAEGVQLDEVVVTALGIERNKKALGYSVTEVSGDDFTEAREINVANALAGKVAGVNVSNMATGPAGSSRVIIRGNSSLTGNNQPLYVVDGIPIDNSNLGNAGEWGGQDWGDGISSISPDDIETMTVLKGNTAAALYGARASNGVILITTKSGTKRKGVGVEVSSNYTFDNIINTYDFQNQYGSGDRGAKPASASEAQAFGLYSWGGQLDGSQVVQWDGVARPYSDVGNNLDRFYRTGSTWTNSMSLSGGDENYNFRIGVTNLQNEGIVPNSGLDRNNFTGKINAKFFDRLSATLSGSYIKEDVKNRPRLSDSPGNANYTAWSMPANVNIETLKGPNGDGSDATGGENDFNDNIYVTNPYWAAYRFRADNNKDRLLGNLTLRYDVFDWLFIQGRIGMDTYNERRTNLEPYGTNYIPLGAITERSFDFTETNKDFMVGVNKQFGSIGLNAFVGGNQMKQNTGLVEGSGNQFNIPFLEQITNTQNRSIGYDVSEEQINSLYGSVELSYNNYLYLTGTARQDWWSTLPENENSLLYPSVGLSFVLSDAVRLPQAITFAKLRTSWAQVGGDTDPYQLLLAYGLFGQGHLGQPLGGITSGQIPNTALTPLTNTEIEFGFDLRMFNNRVGVDFSYYDRKTENDILNAGVSSTSGFGTKVVNVGELTNKGVELLLSVAPVRNNNFRWDVSFNMAYNQSEVVSLLDPEVDDELLQQGVSRTLSAYIFQQEGEPYGIIRGYTYARDDNGNIILDADGLPTRGDIEKLGEGIHPLTLGLRNTFSYKNLNLSFLIDGKFGGDIYAATNSFAYLRGLHQNTLEGRENGEIVMPDGNVTKLEPQNVQDYWSRVSGIAEEFVEDASFIKLRQLTLSYSLPKSVIAKTPFAGISVSLVGRNLAILSKNVDNIDPESTYTNANAQGLEMFGVPQTRSFGVDLNVRF